MSHGNDVAVAAPPSTPCFHSWCEGIYCSTADNGERFHHTTLSSEGDDAEIVGVDLVSNDFADGTATGPQIEITFSAVSETGVTQFSARLSPEAAMRHISAVARAAGIALLQL